MIRSFIEYFDEHPQPSMSEMLDRVEGGHDRTFKQDMQHDNQHFLEEFGESVTLNGVALIAVRDFETAPITRPTPKGSQHRLHGSQPLIGEHLTLTFRTADYVTETRRLPKHSETCRVNGDRFLVVSASEEYGLATLIMQADRQHVPARLPGLYE